MADDQSTDKQSAFEDWLDYYSPDWKKYFTPGEIAPLRAAWDASAARFYSSATLPIAAPQVPGNGGVMSENHSGRPTASVKPSLPASAATTHPDDIIEECALLCEGFQVHYSKLGWAENERTSWVLAQQIREMKTGGKRCLYVKLEDK